MLEDKLISVLHPSCSEITVFSGDGIVGTVDQYFGRKESCIIYSSGAAMSIIPWRVSTNEGSKL
jgi:hypothetical protein